ncbi:MAG TPA: DUF2947 family protein [Burkholderiaceae bacterium]|jgi:hypothetical protein|nr:DUF2947 family protein [Burkholderiaceae bacterium]
MHNETSEQFRALDTEQDWPFFDEGYPIPPEKKERICPLTKSAAESLWCQEVSNISVERHLMLLPIHHWVKPEQTGPNWLTEWDDDVAIGVQQFLRSHFQLLSNETVYFMLMREHAYSIPIDVFTEFWRAFLALDDEGPLLLHPTSGRYAYFGPNGNLQCGQRRSM